jgi:hypothetical protein
MGLHTDERGDSTAGRVDDTQGETERAASLCAIQMFLPEKQKRVDKRVNMH